MELKKMVQTTINSNAYIQARLDLSLVSDEILIRLRNVLTDRRSRTRQFTEYFSGNSIIQEFTFTKDLDNNNKHKIMNVRKVLVDGVEQVWLEDFDVGYRDNSPIYGKIRFYTPPGSVTIEITYDAFYSMIFDEWTRYDLTSKCYPRLSLQLLSSTNRDRAIGGTAHSTDIYIQVTVGDIFRYNVEAIIKQIRDYFALETNKHSFKSFDFIMDGKTGPVLPYREDRNDVVFFQTIDFKIPVQWEFGY
jgi:hypothetical protein